MGAVTAQLAEWIAGVRYQDIPDTAVTLAKSGILDVIGVTLAGMQTELAGRVRTLAAEWGGSAQATVLGTNTRTSAPLAALVNGTAAHALDFDDTNHPLYGHPSCHLVPALLALGERSPHTGRDLIRAYLVGFEVEVRMARAVNMAHYVAGWHATGTLGTLGAAAACSSLLDLTPEDTRHALGIASSMASGLRGNFGTMTKPLHAGLAARNGVMAAQFAERQFTASQDGIAGAYSFTLLYGGGESARIDELSPARFGRPWEITQPYGLAIKQFPSCGATHPGIEAAIALVARHDLDPSAIRSVHVGVSALAPRILIYSRPTTGLEGKFSMEYCVASALAHRRVNLDTFTDAAVAEPVVRQLLERIVVSVDDRVRESTEFSCVVTVSMEDGTTYSEQVDLAKGKTAKPLSRGELEAKYRNCAGRALGDAAVERSLGQLWRLEEMTDVSAFTELLRPSASLSA